MSNEQSLVQFGTIRDMLDDDPEAIKEFSEAAEQSFTSFREEFRMHMNNRDMESLRKVGHRIKPIAQMLGVDPLVNHYYEAKKILQSGSQEAVSASIKKMDYMCNKIMSEFKEKCKT